MKRLGPTPPPMVSNCTPRRTRHGWYCDVHMVRWASGPTCPKAGDPPR